MFPHSTGRSWLIGRLRGGLRGDWQQTMSEDDHDAVANCHSDGKNFESLDLAPAEVEQEKMLLATLRPRSNLMDCFRYWSRYITVQTSFVNKPTILEGQCQQEPHVTR